MVHIHDVERTWILERQTFDFHSFPAERTGWLKDEAIIPAVIWDGLHNKVIKTTLQRKGANQADYKDYIVFSFF